MRHRNRLNKLGLKAGHRNAMIRNMVTSLFDKERIETTRARAKAARKVAEKMITRAKQDSVHNRREVARDITDKDVVNKLFTVLGPRFAQRKGGYTRILKVGYRQGDSAQQVIWELVEKTEKTAKKETKKETKKASAGAKESPVAGKAAPAKKEPAAADSKPEAEAVSADGSSASA